MPQSALRLDEPLLFFQGLVGEIPLQPFRCMLQGFFDFLRRGDDLDRCSKIAARSIRVAVAAGEGKAQGARGSPASWATRCSIRAQYGGNALSIKRGAVEDRLNQLVADFRGGFVGDRKRCQLLAMDRQLFGLLGKSYYERACGGDVDS